MAEDKKVEDKKLPKLGALTPEGTPVVGMKFEDSRKRLLKYKSSRQNPYLKESLIRQVENHEGKEAGEDLRKEINFKYDEESKTRRKVDFIHNPNGKLHSTGIDLGQPRIFTWCDECGQRCYVYTVIKDDYGNSISRCSRCGTDCLDLTEEEYNLKREELDGRKNN